MMMAYNFIITNCDTDSISFCKENFEKFSDEEFKSLIKEVNSIFPELINFEQDGSFDVFIVVKAKNYIMVENGKIKIKGSGLKCTTKSPAEREMINEMIEVLIKDIPQEEMHQKLVEIYHKYILESCNIQDISRWASKKNITSKVLTNERTNEASIRNAISGTDYTEGDRIYIYKKANGETNLIENFQPGDYDVDTMLKKLYNTVMVFSTIIPKELFLNYSLKKNKKLLQELENKE